MNQQILTIRQQNYNIAASILDGSYLKSPQRQKTVSIINQEIEKIVELDEQYQKAIEASNPVIQSSKEQISQLEAKINQISDLEEKLENLVQSIQKSRSQEKNIAQKEISKDMETYSTATHLLEERIQKAQDKLDSIQQTLDSFEAEKILHNPQAQELLIQLRSLLAAQEKELRSLTPH